MPRAPDGTYTLPLPPVLSGQTIEADWANTSLNDLAVALQDSLSRSGQGAMSEQLKLVDGTKGVPAMSFVNEASTGFYRPDAGDLYVSVLGTDYMRWTDDNGVQVSLNGTDWLTVADTDTTDGLQAQIDGNDTELADHEARIAAIETADPFVAASLQVAGEVNQISELVSGNTADTSTANRFLMTNNTPGGITLTITLPVAVRDIGPNYTIEGNIIVSNGATPGAITIAGAAVGEVLGNNSVQADAQCLLSYIIHNRNGAYTKIYIWTAVTA